MFLFIKVAIAPLNIYGAPITDSPAANLTPSVASPVPVAVPVPAPATQFPGFPMDAINSAPFLPPLPTNLGYAGYGGKGTSTPSPVQNGAAATDSKLAIVGDILYVNGAPINPLGRDVNFNLNDGKVSVSLNQQPIL